jgi:uncharacterized coiled-coil protein SlyX
MKLETMIKEQMKTIDKLQEKIKLQQFEITQLRKDVIELKDKLKRREMNQKNIRVKLADMKVRNDFTEINNVLLMLRGYKDE